MLRDNFKKWGPHAGKMVPKSSGGFSISRELKHERNDPQGNAVSGSTNYQWLPPKSKQSQPGGNFQSQPTTNYQWKPPTNNQSKPVVNYQWQPPTNNQFQSAAKLQSQPLANILSQTAANLQAQAAANFQAQPAANFQTQPAVNVGQIVKNGTGQAPSWCSGNQAGVASNKFLTQNVNTNENVQRSQNSHGNLGMQGNAGAMLESRLAKTRGSTEHQHKAQSLLIPGGRNANAILESRLTNTRSTENQCNAKPLVVPGRGNSDAMLQSRITKTKGSTADQGQATPFVPGNATSMLESRLAKTRASTAKSTAIPDRGLGCFNNPVNPSPNQLQSKQADNQSNRKRKASRWDNNKQVAQQDTESNSVTNTGAKRPLLSKQGGSIADTMLQARLAKMGGKLLATQTTPPQAHQPLMNIGGKLMATQILPPRPHQPLMNIGGKLMATQILPPRALQPLINIGNNNNNALLGQLLQNQVLRPNNIPQQLQITGPVLQPNNVPRQLHIAAPRQQNRNLTGPPVSFAGQQNRNLTGPPVSFAAQNTIGNAVHPIQQHVAQQIQRFNAQDIAKKIMEEKIAKEAAEAVRAALPKPQSLMEIPLPGNKKPSDLYSNFKGSEKFKSMNKNEKDAEQTLSTANNAVNSNNTVKATENDGETQMSKKARKRARKRAAKEDGGNVNIGVARMVTIKTAEQQMRNAKAELAAKKIALETNQSGNLFNPPAQRVNRPLLQCRNVLPIQGFNQPLLLQPGNRPLLLQGGNRPLLQGGNRPLLQGGNRPLLQGGNRPLLQGGNRPLLQGGNRPLLQGGNRPLLQAGNRSLIQIGNRPLIQTGNRPSLQTGNMSLLQGGNRPLLQPGNRPLLQGGNRPLLQPGNRPLIQGGNRPLLQPGNRPPVQIGNQQQAQLRNQPRMQGGNWEAPQMTNRPPNLIGEVIPLIANTGASNQMLRKLVDNTVDALMGIPNQNTNLDFNRTTIQLPPNVPASNIPNFRRKQRREKPIQAQKGIEKSVAERREKKKENKKSTVIDLTNSTSDQGKELKGGDSLEIAGEENDMDFDPDDDTDEPMYTVADDAECSEFGLLGLLPQVTDSGKNDESGGTSSLVEFTGNEDLIYSNYSGAYKAKKKENEKGDVESKGKENVGKPMTVNERLAALRNPSQNRKQVNASGVVLNAAKKRRMRKFQK